MDTPEDKDYVLIGVESHGLSLNENSDWDGLQRAIEKFAEEISGS